MDFLTAPRSELIKVIHEKDDRITNLETQIIELKELKSQIDELKRENTKEKKKIFKANTNRCRLPFGVIQTYLLKKK